VIRENRMKSSDQAWREMRAGWEHFGRAAEHLAERVADDARGFARKVEKHVSDFAQELAREQKGGTKGATADEVRRVFDDMRGVLAAVIEGVDDLITEAVSGRERWTRMVAKSEATCAACTRPILPGTECFARRHVGTREYRCTTCGPGEATRNA